MAYVGPWGAFYHIPKCGGISIKYYLKSHYRDPGKMTHNGRQHRIPVPEDDLTNAFTFVRHPAGWMLSFYSYMDFMNWHWPELPDKIDKMFEFSYGMFWPMWVKAITEKKPGIVGQVFDMYCVPGVRVYHLEDVAKVYGEDVGFKNVTEIKPVMTDAEWKMICESESDTLRRYGYNDKR